MCELAQDSRPTRSIEPQHGSACLGRNCDGRLPQPGKPGCISARGGEAATSLRERLKLAEAERGSFSLSRFLLNQQS